MRMEEILVLMGGPSPEAEVSRRSAAAIARALEARGYRVRCAELDKGIFAELLRHPPPFVFPALHGWGGEDGRLQGFLDLMGIPYAGSGVLASALAMDKSRCRRFLEGEVHQPRYFVTTNLELPPGEIPFPPPWVVKPSGGGSSLGVSMVSRAEELAPALRKAGEFEGTILIEERIEGKELSVGVVWGEVLGIVEIVPSQEFYNYEAKYSGTSEYRVNPPLSPQLRTSLERQALRAYELLGCKGCARVDFLARGDTAYFLEVNTMPGMTEHSLVPKMAQAQGISFPELVEWIAFADARPQGRKGREP